MILKTDTLRRILKSFPALLYIAGGFLPAALPAQITDERGIVAEGAGLIRLGGGYRFTEGPAADREGNVYFTDQPNDRIVRWDAETGDLTVFMDGAGRSNGMDFDAEGNLYACADMDNQLWMIGGDKQPVVLVDRYGGTRLNGPNDLWIDPQGGIYFTDPLYPRNYWTRDPRMQQDGEHVYYLGADRQTLIRVDTTLVKPNGIVGTPDGQILYVADIGDNRTYRYDIRKDGTLANRTLFAAMGSDGMTLDSDGNLYLTGRGVTVFDPAGTRIAHIPVEANWTANVCFGGRDHDMLFITAMDAVYGLKMTVKGAGR